MTEHSKWITEGELIDELSEKTVFQNQAIRQFLLSDRKYWLISSKGMGKTLLLRYKRKLTQEKAKNTGIVVIPTGESLDYARLPSSIANESYKLYENEKFWKDVWEASIALSVITHFSLLSLKDWERDRVETVLDNIIIPDDVKEDLLRKIKGNPHFSYSPSDVLCKYLSMGAKNLHKLRNESMQHIQSIYSRFITNGVHVFIDRFDQAILERHPSQPKIWISGQIGLLLSCREINLNCPHIKVFTSIRQEAYSAFDDESKTSMLGASTLIKYKSYELKEMFEKFIYYYEGKSSVNEFLKCKSMHNIWVNKKEDCFDYIYRHTNGTPRSIVAIGDALSNVVNGNHWKKDNGLEDMLKNEINNISSEEIIRNYLRNEMKSFLTALNSEDKIIKFFKLLKNNIFSFEMLEAISFEFNRIVKQKSEGKLHPFCELYNLGLLGDIKDRKTIKKRLQSFNKPYDFNWNMQCIIPTSQYYFIHPSLTDYIQNFSPDYKVSTDVLIGDTYLWEEEYDKKLLSNTRKIFISYSSRDSEMVNKIVKSIQKTFLLSGKLCDIWLDKWKIHSGDWFQDKIEHGITDSDILLLLVSKDSLNSGWVDSEWRTKIGEELSEKGVKVITCFIDNDVRYKNLPAMLQNKHAVRVVSKKAIQPRQIKTLVNDIECHLGGE